MARTKLSPGALYTRLIAELKARRTEPCGCRMPLPFHVERPDDVSANWRIGTAPPCANGCDTLIAEIAAQMWPQYDLLESITEMAEEKPSLPEPG